jgi:outer membrane protein assembly factor BamB
MNDDHQLLPPEIAWYQTPFFRRLIALVCPPLGLLLVWSDANCSRRRRVVATAGILVYCPFYAALLIWLAVLAGVADIEWEGGFGPSIVWHKTTPDYLVLERNRQSQREHGTVPVRPDEPAPYWTDFRGPRRDGCYDERPIQTDWNNGDPRLLWRQPIGGGYASFVVAGGLAFTIEQRREREAVTAYQLETGREVWAFHYPALFSEWMGGDGPRATPTYCDGLVYSLGATGELCCLRATTGEVVWRTDVLKDTKAMNLHYGMAASPLVRGDQLIVLSGEAAPGNAVIAYDRRTGRRLWATLWDKQAYASPLAATLAGQPQVLIVTASRALGLATDGSKVLWDFPWKVEYDNAICLPLIVATNRFFLSAGYGAGCALVEVNPNGTGFQAREVWRNRNMKNKFNASVFHDGFIYGLDEGVLTCLDARTGARKWRGGRYGYGQLLLASGHLIVLGGEGELALVKATAESFQEVGRVQALEGKTWNVPALAAGRLLVRNASQMACFDLRDRGQNRFAPTPPRR